MKRVRTIVGIGAVLAGLVAPVQAAVVENATINLDLELFVPCANGGAGETVVLSGPLHVLITFTVNGKNVSGKTHFQPQGISGVGLDTGKTYHATGVTQDHFKGFLTDGQFNQTFVNNFRIIGQGRGNNFLVHENFHFAVNAKGEVTASHDNFSTVCK